MKNFWKNGNQIGVFLALVFVVCFIWFWLHPVQQDLQMRSFEVSFYGYTGMNLPSFVLGVIQSYVWGYIGVALWRISSRFCSKKK